VSSALLDSLLISVVQIEALDSAVLDMNNNFGPREGEPRATVIPHELAMLIADHSVGWTEPRKQLGLGSSGVRFTREVMKHPVNPRFEYGHEDQHIEKGVRDNGEEKEGSKHAGETGESPASGLYGRAHGYNRESGENGNQYHRAVKQDVPEYRPVHVVQSNAHTNGRRYAVPFSVMFGSCSFQVSLAPGYWQPRWSRGPLPQSGQAVFPVLPLEQRAP